MKPAPFGYLRPASVEEALAALAAHGDDAKILGGGQSLVPLLNFRVARPEVLIDINGLGGELDYIRREADGTLAVGALTRHRTLELSPLLAPRHALLAEAVPWIGDAAIRNRGTVGGSLVHNDPAGELGTVLLALEGEVVLRGPGGERRERAADFLAGSYLTSIEEGEMLVEARFPPAPEGAGEAFMEIARRRGDFALVGAAACLRIGPDGAVEEARLALSGAGEAPRRMAAAEAQLTGRRWDGEAARAAAEAAAEEAEPIPDLHGGEAYRRNLVRVFARRALERAAVRAAAGRAAGAGSAPGGNRDG